MLVTMVGAALATMPRRSESLRGSKGADTMMEDAMASEEPATQEPAIPKPELEEIAGKALDTLIDGQSMTKQVLVAIGGHIAM